MLLSAATTGVHRRAWIHSEFNTGLLYLSRLQAFPRESRLEERNAAQASNLPCSTLQERRESARDTPRERSLVLSLEFEKPHKEHVTNSEAATPTLAAPPREGFDWVAVALPTLGSCCGLLVL